MSQENTNLNGLDLRAFQAEVAEWKKNNFPNSGDVQQFIGVVEEVGELAHAILKSLQGIRGDEHEAEARDAVGDIMIFLLNFCSANGWDLEDILVETWDEVKERDWIQYPEAGIGDE